MIFLERCEVWFEYQKEEEKTEKTDEDELKVDRGLRLRWPHFSSEF